MFSLVNDQADEFSTQHIHYTKEMEQTLLLRSDNVILVHKGASFICIKVV